MDHPVYDCLYLACADATKSVLITADHRFAKKAAGSSVDVWPIGSAGVADRIEMAASAPVIGGEKIEELVKAYEVFALTEEHVRDKLKKRTDPGIPYLEAKDFDLFLDTPAFKRLVDLVEGLSDDERIDLLALGWFGDGRLNGKWLPNLEHAYKMTGSQYVASYGRE